MIQNPLEREFIRQNQNQSPEGVVAKPTLNQKAQRPPTLGAIRNYDGF